MSHASTLFRSLFLSFAAFSMFLFAPSSVGAAPVLPSGSGEQEDPYLISSCGNLEYIAVNEEDLYATTNYYELTQNLDCRSVGNAIVLGNTAHFHGVFDGKGYTIAIDLDDTTASMLALFKSTSLAIIKNLQVAGTVNVSDGDYIGGVVGFLTNGSSLLNVRSSVVVSAGNADMVGGLVGSSSANSDMHNLHFKGQVTGDTMVGGIVGYLALGSVKYSFSDGTVTGNEAVGGVVGRASEGVEIAYTVNDTPVISAGDYMGALVGEVTLWAEPSIVSATENMVGNVIAHADTVYGYDNPSCLVYEDALEAPQAFYSPCSMVDVTAGNSYFYDSSNAPYTNGTDDWNMGVYDDWYFSGSALPTLNAFRNRGFFSGSGAGTPLDPYIITSCAEFKQIEANMSASYQIQVAPEEGEDIPYLNCTAEGNDIMIRHPLHDFSGTLDGGGVVLIMDIDFNNRDNVGLFAELDGAIIQNMYLSGTVDTLGSNYVGALAGHIRESEIYAVFADATVTASGNYVGGMAGNIFELSTVEGVSGTGEVSGGEYVGGLFGQMLATSVSQAIANTPVTGVSSVGGFAGRANTVEWDQISSMGDVIFAYPTGMDAEDYTNEGAFMGAVTGEAFLSIFTNLKVIATVTGDYSLGSVSGIMDSDSSIRNAYLDTVLTYDTELEVEGIPAAASVGPVIGLGIGEGTLQSELPTVMEAYYAEDTYTGLESTLGTALSAGQMEDVMSFEGFDFQDVWGFDVEVTGDRAYLSFEYPGGLEYIQDCDGLDDIREALSSTYMILNNIDCSAYKTNIYGEGSGLGFEPIGSFVSPFTGDLMSHGDQKFEISGLYINSSNSYSGLFGSIENGSVQGIELVGDYENDELLVAQGSFSGALAGSIQNTYVSNITSSMVLSLTSNADNLVAVGGLIGRVGTDSTVNDVEIVPDATSDILAGDIRFEGQNPVMVYINNPDYDVQGSGGVIGQVCQEGGECSISNVTMEASTFVLGQDVYRVGGLIGALFTNDGGTSRLWAPEGSTLVVDAEAPEQIGTLVGRLENTEMLESSSEMKLYVRAGDSTAGDIGGLVGSGSDIMMEDVFYDGIFEVNFDTVLGYTAEAFGALVGDASGVYLQNTYTAGEMTITNPGENVDISAVGGLIGQAFITEGDRINSSFVETEMNIDATVSEKHILLGRGLYDVEETWGLDEFLRDNYYNGVNLSGSGLECAPGLTEEMEYSGEDLMCAAQWGGPSIFHANNDNGPLPNWDFSSVWRLYPVGAPRLRALYRPAEPSPFEGEGTEEDPKIISNCGQFALMDDDIFAAGDVYQFTDSLDCAGWDLELSFQEHPFTGVLDGTTNTIYNMEMSGFFTDVALFAQTNGAVFRNINFEDTDVYTNLGSASVLVKEATDTSFENIDFDTVSVDGWDEVGVLASHVDGGTFENITMNDAFVEGDFNVGTIFGVGENGIVNMSEILIRNSSVNLDDEGLGENVGGLVGRFEGESLIGNTIAYEGNVYGTTYVGGLGGLMYNMDITHAYFDGVVFEQLEADGSYFGGLFGYAENSDMQKMYSHGTLDLGGSNLGAMIIGSMDGGTLTDTVGNMEIANAFTDTRGVVSFTRNGAVLSENYFTNNSDLNLECYDEGDVDEACEAIDTGQPYFYTYMIMDPFSRFDEDVWHAVYGGMPRFNIFAELPYNFDAILTEGAYNLVWTLPDGYDYLSHEIHVSSVAFPETTDGETLFAFVDGADSEALPSDLADGFYYFSLFTTDNNDELQAPLYLFMRVDRTSPTGEFFSPDVEYEGTTSLDSIDFALTFNENVHDMSTAAFTIENATVLEEEYSVLYNQYFFVIQPTAAGEVVVSLPEGTFEDESGNPTPALDYRFTYAPEEDDDTPRGGGGGGGGKSRSSNSRTNEVKTSEEESSEESTETLSENIFGDMDGHFAKEYVETLFKQGVVQGRSEGKYEPDAEMNRAELAKIAVKMFFPEATPNLELLSQFSDVDATAWYAPFMAVLVQEGVLQGYADGTLKPAESVNRAEALKMLMAAAGLELVQENPEWSFGDVPAGAWFEAFVKTAYQLGIVQGKSPSRFAPALPVTRGEMAKMAVLSQNAKLKP